MRKTIVAIVTTSAAVLSLTACDPEEVGIHPETRSVVKKGQDAGGYYLTCRSSWTDKNGTPQHRDQRKELTAKAFQTVKVGDPC